MNISELHSLSWWVKEHVDSPQIYGLYSALIEALKAYAQPNQRAQSFDAQRAQLIEALAAVPLLDLTKEQIAFLDKAEIAPAIGSRAIETVEDALYRNVIDAATSANILQQIADGLNRGIDRMNQVRSALKGAVKVDSNEVAGEVMLRVVFAGDASMTNVSDFKEWGKNWYEISRGITMAHDTAPEAVRVVGASNGSIILELSVDPAIASTVSSILLAALTVAERFLTVRKQAEEIRGLKLANDKLAEELEKEAVAERDKAVEKITASTAKKLKLAKSKDGEKYNALEKSVEQLVSFVSKGGEVDFVVPDDHEGQSNATLEEVRLTYREIRRVETKISFLELRASHEDDKSDG